MPGEHMNIIMIGMAGSGKGTQAKRIAKEFNLKHISAGDVLRAEVAKGTELGKKIQKCQQEGVLVPVDIVVNAMKENMDNNNILDGFPRSLDQAEALDEIAQIDLVISLDIPDEVAIDRLSRRRQCKQCGAITDDSHDKCPECGGELYQREDDKPEAIKKRLDVYHDETEPLLEYYKPRDIVRRIDGTKTPDEIFEEIKEIIRNTAGQTQ